MRPSDEEQTDPAARPEPGARPAAEPDPGARPAAEPDPGARLGGIGSTEAALRALEERLSRASDAAERLLAEAATAAASGAASAVSAAADALAGDAEAGNSGAGTPGAGTPGATDARRTPPAGWAAPGADDRGPTHGSRFDGEIGGLIEFVRSLRELLPPDLQQRLAEALRELLLAVRALIDWYLERLEHRRRTPTPVEDIPIF